MKILAVIVIVGTLFWLVTQLRSRKTTATDTSDEV